MDGHFNIVPGEAPESDDEDLVSNVRSTALQGTAIVGEAPESDSSPSDIEDDGGKRVNSVGSASSAASALSLLSPTTDSSKAKFAAHSKEDTRYNSLLHKKLRERNSSLRRSVDDFIHQTVGTAARDLNSIDQHLLKSQVTLQEAATSLRILQSNLSHIHSRLSLITSSTYLPVININYLYMGFVLHLSLTTTTAMEVTTQMITRFFQILFSLRFQKHTHVILLRTKTIHKIKIINVVKSTRVSVQRIHLK